MKKKLMSLFAAAMLLSACGNGTSVQNNGSTDGSASGNEGSDTVKIGVNLELSGEVSAYGNAELQGIKLAVEEINAAGGILDKQIELVEKDNKSSNDEAASVAANLADKEKVVAVVGPATSGATKASLANLTKMGVPVITPSGTDDAITLNGNQVQEYAFRSCFQDSFQGVILAKYADENLKASKAIILGDSASDYAKGLTKAFKGSYQGEIVAEENFVAGDKDFQAVLTNIKGKDFDVLYIPGYYTEAGLIIKQAREMGIEQPIIGADGFGDEKLVEIAGEKNVSNIFYTAHFSTSAPANDKVEPFIAAFTEKYDSAPAQFSALAYDAIYMIKQAIEDQEAATPAAITKGLTELKDFVGVTGTMTMDEQHNPEKSAVVLGMTEGKETSAETVNP
ncbi:branched-chain amino acid transport system substrate-binding protein [Enterococcus sp. PF1-24]|uniref:ABC transporter substrate-binding protein n=1 Tax=unclassified Enterococcus TaxID=2608891 RepID=UPI002476180D|nr:MULTISPECIES: ABC transporter substrate-binding protein [unclassified Enterococcus]MDH6365435.1 branched-chain amino acid transport system substrate-binding protein [Enterococcus sp. PFB1-1]MDH6402536.1 branched-chain amino acid transport system substrate-binding protein [Enterococcus sp. PF1-24]